MGEKSGIAYGFCSFVCWRLGPTDYLGAVWSLSQTTHPPNNPPPPPPLRWRWRWGRAVAPQVMRGLMPPAPPSRGLPCPRTPACYRHDHPQILVCLAGGPNSPRLGASASKRDGAPFPRRMFLYYFGGSLLRPLGGRGAIRASAMGPPPQCFVVGGPPPLLLPPAPKGAPPPRRSGARDSGVPPSRGGAFLSADARRAKMRVGRFSPAFVPRIAPIMGAIRVPPAAYGAPTPPAPAFYPSALPH